MKGWSILELHLFMYLLRTSRDTQYCNLMFWICKFKPLVQQLRFHVSLSLSITVLWRNLSERDLRCLYFAPWYLDHLQRSMDLVKSISYGRSEVKGRTWEIHAGKDWVPKVMDFWARRSLEEVEELYSSSSVCTNDGISCILCFYSCSENDPWWQSSV